jgi:hypothetical protein
MEAHPFRAAVAIAFCLVLGTLSRAEADLLKPMPDVDSHAIYAALLPAVWANSGAKGVMLLQRETVTPYACSVKDTPFDPEWDAIQKKFSQERPTQLLSNALHLAVPYRFVAQSTIAAETARLARRYPGWQAKPVATQYAAVSVVTFNPQRTRAMVYVRLRDSGDVYSMEKRDGRWVHAPRAVCAWRA